VTDIFDCFSKIHPSLIVPSPHLRIRGLVISINILFKSHKRLRDLLTKPTLHLNVKDFVTRREASETGQALKQVATLS
jgi:hypothetical protein